MYYSTVVSSDFLHADYLIEYWRLTLLLLANPLVIMTTLMNSIVTTFFRTAATELRMKGNNSTTLQDV